VTLLDRVSLPKPERLKNKVVVITGAGRGIGRAIAMGLAKNGARLAITSRTEAELHRTEEELNEHGAEVLAVAGDVSNPLHVNRFINKVTDVYGRIDVLVNNAGVLGPIGPIEENRADMWRYAIEVNLFGVFLLCKYVIPHMKRQRSGKIINISGAGAPSPYPRFTAYSASKTGVLGLTQTLAEELKDFNIQVNAVAPGIADTRMQDEILAAGESAGAAFTKAKEVKEGKGVELSKVAELVAFLASDMSNGITGKYVSARWDDWRSFSKRSNMKKLLASNIYTIQRIDNVFYGETKVRSK
jgi:3-oxoacyl-[acyl-carrier protein] reductase